MISSIMRYKTIVTIIFFIFVASLSQLSSRSLSKISLQHHHENLSRLMEDYVSQHSIDVLRRESSQDFCKRTFSVSYHWQHMECGGSFGTGNLLGPVLNSAVRGVVYNRTLYVYADAKQINQTCDDGIAYRSWVPFATEVEAIAARHDCLHQLLRSKDVCEGCNCSHSSLKIQGSPSGNNVGFDFLTEEYDPYLDGEALRRSRIMFMRTYDDGPRFLSNGIALSYLIEFRYSVHKVVNDIMNTILSDPDAVRISVHIRHKEGSDDDVKKNPLVDIETDTLAMQGISKFKKIASGKSCFVLIASDRMYSMERLTNYSRNIGCVPLSIPRGEKNTTEATSPEHGKWSRGIISVADWYLLSHATYFIGVHRSSYSLLIGDLVSLNALKTGVTHNTLAWISGSELRSFHESPGVVNCRGKPIQSVAIAKQL